MTLPVGVAREAVAELDVRRDLERGECSPPAQAGTSSASHDRAPSPHDDCLHLLAQDLVGHAHDDDVGDVGMPRRRSSISAG